MCNRRHRTKFIQKDEQGNLFCYKCFSYKPIEAFDTNTNRWYREHRDSRCKQCKSEQHIKRKLYNRGRKDLDRLLLERWHGLRDRAKKNGLIVDFTWEFLKELWITQEGKCAISGKSMTYIMDNGRVPTNLSVDRIDNTIGYLKHNIQLVCMAVNQMKSDLTINQLLEFCNSILKYNHYEN